MKTNLRSTSGVLSIVEDTLNQVQFGEESKSVFKVADIRLRGCKHALQIMALNYSMAIRSNKLLPKKLKHLTVE